MTRDEKIERIRFHAGCMMSVASEYAIASTDLNFATERGLDILLAIGESVQLAHAEAVRKFEPVVRGTNN